MKTSMSQNLVDLLPLNAEVDFRNNPPPEIELLESALDYVPDMVHIQDRNFIVRLVNDAFCQKTGLMRSEVLGRDAFDLYPNAIADACESAERRVFSNHEMVRSEEKLVNKSGSELLVDTVRIPLLNSRNEFQGIFAIGRDITEEKKREKERESLINSLKDTLNMLEKQSKVLKRMNTQLQDLATTDELTQVSNRRHFDYHLDIEWRRCRREKKPLALMFFDIDYFKRFNDHYGHTSGDVCLRSVANVLSEQMSRPGDVFARYGGEEFVALLPNTSEGIETIAERCRQAVWELNIEHVKAGLPGSRVTVSCGAVVGYPHLLESSKDLVDLADQNLYLAKQAGRNRFEFTGLDNPAEIKAG